MKRQLRDAYCAALRSGKYSQRTGFLKTQYPGEDARYCALGVLREVAGFDWTAPEDQDSDNVFYAGPREHCVTNVIPAPERLLIGLSHEDHDRIWELNDVRRLSFPDIADWVEQNIPVTD